MRRFRYFEYGGPEVLQLEEVDAPEPGPGQVLIQPEVIGASYIDTVMRSGASLSHQVPLPGSPHGDVVGTVVQTGPGVSETKVGDRVAAFVPADAYADYVLAGADWLVKVPPGIDRAVATALALPAPVAIGALRAGRVTRGDTVVVHAAAGGIGHLAVQLAKLEGAATVIATAGSSQKLGVALRSGADAAVSYGDRDWAEQIRRHAPGGVDLILDSLGGHATATGMTLLGPLGRTVIYGTGSGQPPELTGAPLTMRTITGFGITAWRAAKPDSARAEVRDLVAYARADQLEVAVHATVPLADAARAHELLEDRSRVGRVLLEP